ncbi:uncharacterized protein [Anabrus simplex]
MALRTLLLLILCHQVSLMQPSLNALPAIQHLTAEPDFRDVTLRWEYIRQAPGLAGFQVRYCELQAWGPHRCRTKTIDDSSGHDVMTVNSQMRMYSIIISGLRMSTNYSFEVRPLEMHSALEVLETRVLGKGIVVPTRGFSARATQCLPHASEVEVLTGPHFGGRIAVEAADGERCAVDGDPESSRDTYILRINHRECGSHQNSTTVATYVLVQENLPILTHSTRRFLVLCTYQPETLTVRAGINLPSQGSRDDPNSDNMLDQSHSQAIPYDASQLQLESVNDVRVSRLLHDRQTVEARSADSLQDQSVAQLVLMVILLVAGVSGLAIAAWWSIPSLKKHVAARSLPADGGSSSSVYENFENSLRDTVSIAGSDNSSSDCDSITLVTEECPHQSADQDKGNDGVFTIRIPAATSQPERPCITIEHTSHSEA